MIRFILSIIILTLIVLYAMAPAMKHINKLVRKEKARIKNSYEEDDAE